MVSPAQGHRTRRRPRGREQPRRQRHSRLAGLPGGAGRRQGAGGRGHSDIAYGVTTIQELENRELLVAMVRNIMAARPTLRWLDIYAAARGARVVASSREEPPPALPTRDPGGGRRSHDHHGRHHRARRPGCRSPDPPRRDHGRAVSLALSLEGPAGWWRAVAAVPARARSRQPTIIWASPSSPSEASTGPSGRCSTPWRRSSGGTGGDSAGDPADEMGRRPAASPACSRASARATTRTSGSSRRSAGSTRTCNRGSPRPRRSWPAGTRAAAASQVLFDLQRELGRSKRLATMGHLAATIAHEIGSPLNSIACPAAPARSPNLAPGSGRLTTIDGQVRRLVQTVQEHLTPASVSRGAPSRPISMPSSGITISWPRSRRQGDR